MHAASHLIGRSAELALLEELFATVAGSRALLFTGEAGVGKSALLEVAAQRAAERGFRVSRVVGSQFEERVGFSALNQILQPLADGIPALPSPQAEMLRVVCGTSEAQPAGLPAVVNAVQMLLSRQAAKSGPVALIVDDAAWLDRPSAMVLGTVARNAPATALALLAASRTGDESLLDSMGIATHEVRPLGEEAANELVAQRFPVMTARVRQRLVTEAAGNPLALLELPSTLSKAQQQETGPLPAVLPLSERLKRIFSVRVGGLPETTRELLLLAVLDGSGDPHILELATGGSDVLTELGPAEKAEVVRVDSGTGRLVFRHPLTRSAVMELSTSAERPAGASGTGPAVPGGIRAAGPASGQRHGRPGRRSGRLAA